MDKEPESNAWKKRKKMAADSINKDKYYLTREQIGTLTTLFPNWTMERDENGYIVIYPNLQDNGIPF